MGHASSVIPAAVRRVVLEGSRERFHTLRVKNIEKFIDILFMQNPLHNMANEQTNFLKVWKNLLVDYGKSHYAEGLNGFYH